MVCSTCPGCLGPLEKLVAVQVSGGEFVLYPDRAYHGKGQIDSIGIVEVRVNPEEDYWGSPRHRNFWFNGSYSNGVIKLHGERGERTCELILRPKES